MRIILFSAVVLAFCACGRPPKASSSGAVSEALLQRVTDQATRERDAATLPTVPNEVHDWALDEIRRSAGVSGAIARLDPKNSNLDWFAGIDALEHEKAAWSLQACLCHPHDDVQAHALIALSHLKNSASVPFLLVYGYYMDTMVAGSESATVHGLLQQQVAATLSSITGVQVNVGRRQDAEGLREALANVGRWLLEHPQRPNQAMQPTPGRRTLKFPMIQTSTPAATRALASGG